VPVHGGQSERVGEVHRRGVRHLQLVHVHADDWRQPRPSHRTGVVSPRSPDVLASAIDLASWWTWRHGTLRWWKGRRPAARRYPVPHHIAYRRLDPFTRLISGDHGKLVASTAAWSYLGPAPPCLARPLRRRRGARRGVPGVDHVGSAPTTRLRTIPGRVDRLRGLPPRLQLLRRTRLRRCGRRQAGRGNYVRVSTSRGHRVRAEVECEG